MIKALIKRRYWLWSSRLVLTLSTTFLLPIMISILVILPLKNIILYSLSEVPYEIWVYPGFIFLISSLALFPSIYRDFFDLRIHRKLLINVVLTPYSKSTIISSYLICAVIEALFFGIISAIVYFLFIEVDFLIVDHLVLFFFLSLHLLLLGNLFFSLCLFINSISVIWITILLLFIFILFGNGFIVQLEFFPPNLETILKNQPFSLSFQAMQRFLNIETINWIYIIIISILIYIWVLTNGYILKKKFQQ